jgi:hypothetical protein
MIQTDHVQINAIITEFDIDTSDLSRLFSFKCKRCQVKITDENNNNNNLITIRKCPNQNCKNLEIGYDKYVDKTLSITDHTGTLNGLRINAKLFERIIGKTVILKNTNCQKIS